MGDHLIIIGATGTAKPGLVAALMAVLSADGLQVRHASRRYQGVTHFETGGPPDLKAELTGVDVPAENATLETVLAEVRAHREEFREACHGTKPPALKTEEGPQKGAKKRKKDAEGEGGKNTPVTTELPKLDEPSAKPPTEPPPSGQQDTTGDGASGGGSEEQAANAESFDGTAEGQAAGSPTAEADETPALPAQTSAA